MTHLLEIVYYLAALIWSDVQTWFIDTIYKYIISLPSLWTFVL